MSTVQMSSISKRTDPRVQGKLSVRAGTVVFMALFVGVFLAQGLFFRIKGYRLT